MRSQASLTAELAYLQGVDRQVSAVLAQPVPADVVPPPVDPPSRPLQNRGAGRPSNFTARRQLALTAEGSQ